MDRAWQESPSAPLLGGRYRLGECIGRGGMGQVHRAEDVVLGRTVAVKIVAADRSVSNSPDRVRNEVALLAAVQHPSLVTLLDARIDDAASSYLVMEFVDGPSLARRLQGGPLTEVEVASLAVDLASGLHAVHAAGIVHRDLTPANILLAPAASPRVPFHAKLADFGVAFLIDSTRLTTPGMVVGTAAYLAPEQVRGDAAAPPADIYALGLVLLEAFTGERAYPHASGIGAVMARLVEPPAIAASVRPEWSALLSRMVSSVPAERPSAREVVAITTELRKTARHAPVAGAGPLDVPAPGAKVAAPARPDLPPVPTQPLDAAQILSAPLPAPVAAPLTAPVAAALPAPVAAARRRAAHASPMVGSGERAQLRRARTRKGRMRRTAVLVGTAVIIAALAIPAGLWATAGYPQEPSVVAIVPDDGGPDPIVPADVGASGGGEVVPASSTSDVATEPDAEKVAEKQAREQQKQEQAQQRERAKAQAAAERSQAKADREAENATKKATKKASRDR
ncbi:serine/threonine-protein kinase [Microbacterium sp. SSM24]|uniref:serine/threonine-protein kinase n=1 Tax=Microbacterium sp. SSM24 TaxID=2991714 RepID=UPI00222623D5|nr:serine/threonine-protein kinase [Microbacterium sp. SSM24]MCW3491945.1 serine/threonine protein kinase [Microbacterium sp. SSM24]